MLRCADLGIGPLDTDYFTVGMVLDMMTEKSNDNEEYPYKPTQHDFDSL